MYSYVSLIYSFLQNMKNNIAFFHLKIVDFTSVKISVNSIGVLRDKFCFFSIDHFDILRMKFDMYV